MRLTEQKAKRIYQDDNIDGLFKQVEQAARTCYKSEDKIMEGSANKIVQNLINNKHYAMLEHGTVYLAIPIDIDVNKYKNNPYSVVNQDENYWYITTNYRVILENRWESDMNYQTNKLPLHEERITIKCITSIGIARELCRHRKFSFAQESTRYCNYSSNKFSNELTFVIPYWVKLNPGPYQLNMDNGLYWEGDGLFMEYVGNNIDTPEIVFLDCCFSTSKDYNNLTRLGYKAQEKREILPLSLKTEIVMTGFKSDWDNFFDLRLHESTGKVHPDMKSLAKLIHDNIYDNL